MSEYPKWVFHKQAPGGKLVNSPEQLAVLGKGWVDSTADFAKKPDPPKEPKPSGFSDDGPPPKPKAKKKSKSRKKKGK